MFKKRKLRKRFEKIGSQVDVAYLLYLNNQEPIHFPSESDAMKYIQDFRQENEIFKLQIFRIETYSL